MGVGGIIGSFSIGHLIDWSQRPRWLQLALLIMMTVAIGFIPIGLQLDSPLMFVPFLLWGMAGWASLAPQQHVLLQLQPENGTGSRTQ